MKIVPLRRSHDRRVAACAALAREAFGGDFDTLDALRKGSVGFVAIDGKNVAGWIAAMPQYGGCVWEIHPLVVANDHQRSGIGTALIERLEREVRKRGAITLWAGSDDESNQTTLGGADLYRDLPSAIANIRNLRAHPYEFYLKVGFKIVGVMPDANGFGKPDIFLAKRVAVEDRRPRLSRQPRAAVLHKKRKRKKPAAGDAAG